jgi:hypothetical protein
MKIRVTITLDDDVHEEITEVYKKERKNLSNEVNSFLIRELVQVGFKKVYGGRKIKSVIPTLWTDGKNPDQFQEIKKAIKKRK